VALLKQYPDMVIQLEGHTDRQGGRSANMELSEDRVLEIKNYLVNTGINPKRIKTAAFGDTRPISTENTEESRQLNRRVEVRIISI
jgi:outer membrane protein OmpA-like peptidoglycan-associated protein